MGTGRLGSREGKFEFVRIYLSAYDGDIRDRRGAALAQEGQIAIGKWLEFVAAPQGVGFGLESAGIINVIIVIEGNVQAQRGAIHWIEERRLLNDELDLIAFGRFRS